MGLVSSVPRDPVPQTLKHAGTIQAPAPKYIEKISSGVIARALGRAIAGATPAVLVAARLAGVEFIPCAGTVTRRAR